MLRRAESVSGLTCLHACQFQAYRTIAMAVGHARKIVTDLEFLGGNTE